MVVPVNLVGPAVVVDPEATVSASAASVPHAAMAVVRVLRRP
jgi:hypothetical protein